MLTFGQFERELTSERVKDKMLERAKKGYWNGGSLPYGYKSVKKKLVVDKNEAKLVRYIFDSYLECGSVNKIYADLKNNGIKHSSGRIFSINCIHYLVRNIIYTGKIKYADTTYKGIHKPIISQTTFELAQELHKHRVKKFNLLKTFPFAGTIRCKACNYAMSPSFANKHKDGKLKRYFYYRCINTCKNGTEACPVTQVNADRLDLFIFSSLEDIYNSEYYLDNYIYRINTDKDFRSRLGIELRPPGNSFSIENVRNCISQLLKVAKATAGKERNIQIKKYIKEIIYSPEEIEIQLYYRPFSDEVARNLGVEKCRAEDPPESAGDTSASLSINSEALINNEFDRLVSLKKLELVPVRGIELPQVELEFFRRKRFYEKSEI